MANEAEISYQNVKRTLQALRSKLAQADREGSNLDWLSYFQAVERLLEELRLSCMATIFVDFKYAHEKKVGSNLWQCHTLINSRYRKTAQKLKDTRQGALLRKVEQLHAQNLHTAQYFYKGYIQRLSARYELPALQRIARSMGAAPIAVDETIDARAAGLETEVELSCYDTLLHLGDLARYRKQMRQKGPLLQTALDYYGLAQDMIPTMGDAHHQMAVLYIKEDKRDFEIIYHFYRALAVEHPHQNALDNLKQEFDKLVSSSQRGGYSAPDPQRTFAQWFSRLHARFYLGEAFSGQDELEKEVLHRFELLISSPANADLLLQAVLVNISAYHVALQRVKENWTVNVSRSTQFILRCNTRFITTLSRIVLSQVEQATTGPTATQEKIEENQDVDKSFETALRLLRIYLAWIYTNRDDLVKYHEHLQPYILDMHRYLTECLSTAARIVLGVEVRGTLPYLLPEDVEVTGLLALDGWNKYHTLDDGTKKPPYYEWSEPRKSHSDENLARLYDLLICGCHLAIDPAFPYVESRIDEGGRQWVDIAYAEDYQPLPLEKPSVETQDVGKGVADLADKFDHLTALVDRPAESVDNFDVNVYSLLNDFLAPPESTTPAPEYSEARDASYGMHTSTVNDVFGGLGASNNKVASTFMKPIPSLPWEPFTSDGPSGWNDTPSSKGHAHRTSLGTAFTNAAPSNPWDSHEPKPTNFGQQDAEIATQNAPWGIQNNAPGSGFPTPGSEELGPSGWPSKMVPTRSGTGYQQSTAPASGLASSALPSNDGYSFPGSMNFSAASSSLPPVNSPRGLPQHQQQRMPPPPNYSHEPQRYDSLGRPIPPGSTEGLTAAGHANITSQWYQATTAWGQAPPSADDPTHYRNQNSTGARMSRAYDKNALYSALEDYGKPKPR